jgi:glycosyltransferase involved in cell wall biosynthesis
MTSYYSILFVSHYTDLYGANRSMLNLIDGLKQKGINDISVIIPHKGAVCNKLNDLGIIYQVIPFVLEVQKQPQSYLKKTAKKYYNLLLAKKYKRYFFKKKNLIIHTNTSVTFFGAYLAYYLQVPHVWHIREFGKTDYKLEYNFGYSYFLKWINRAASVICISKVLCDHRFKENIIPPLKIIYNGVVHCSVLNTGIISNKKSKRFRFGISGNISDEKNQVEAIHAFNLMHKNYDCELFIAGTGEPSFLNQLKQKIEKYNLTDRVLFKGFVNDISTFNKSLHCMLMCAKHEALGRVTIEAMSEGLPVIGFDNAGTAEIIEDGYNGFLYKNGATELAEKMKFIINNYETLTSVRLHAIETVKKNYTIESYAEKVADIYELTAKKYYS